MTPTRCCPDLPHPGPPTRCRQPRWRAARRPSPESWQWCRLPLPRRSRLLSFAAPTIRPVKLVKPCSCSAHALLSYSTHALPVDPASAGLPHVGSGFSQIGGENYALSLVVMTPNEQTMTIAFTSEIIGGLVVRSVSLAAGVALAILARGGAFLPVNLTVPGGRFALGRGHRTRRAREAGQPTISGCTHNHEVKRRPEHSPLRAALYYLGLDVARHQGRLRRPRAIQCRRPPLFPRRCGSRSSRAALRRALAPRKERSGPSSPGSASCSSPPTTA